MNRAIIILITIMIVFSSIQAGVLGIEGGSMSSLDTMLANEGVDMTMVTIPTSDSLDGILLHYRWTDYTTAEINWIQEFVFNGGIVIIPGEWRSLSDWNDNANDLLSDSGWDIEILIRSTLVSDSVHAYDGPTTLTDPYCWFYATDIWDEPLMHNIDRLAFFATSVLIVGPSADICCRTFETAKSEDFSVIKVPLIAIQDHGAGKVIVLGDSNILNMEGDPLMVVAWRDSDNRQLITNLAYMLNGGIPFVSEIEKPEESTITVHPNPFNSSCEIRCFGKVSIYDLSGKLVHEFDAPGTWEPNVTDPAGIYLIRNSEGKKTKAILLK